MREVENLDYFDWLRDRIAYGDWCWLVAAVVDCTICVTVGAVLTVVTECTWAVGRTVVVVFDEGVIC